MYHIFFIHSSVSGYLGCFHVLATVNSVAMNIGMYVSVWVMVFSGYMHRGGIAGWIKVFLMFCAKTNREYIQCTFATHWSIMVVSRKNTCKLFKVCAELDTLAQNILFTWKKDGKKIMVIQIWVFGRHFLEMIKVNLSLQGKTTDKCLLPMLKLEFSSKLEIWTTFTYLQIRLHSQVLGIKKLPTVQETWVRKIAWRRAWRATPVFLPRESPWTETPGGLQFMR